MLVYNVQRGIYDDAGVEHVELTMRLTAAEAADLVAALRPSQTPALLADDARPIAEPVAWALFGEDPA